MKMNTMGLFIAFCAVLVIAYMTIGFTSSVVEPNNTTAAGLQYQNLSKATDIANTGMQGYLLLLILALVLSGVFLVYNSITRRR